jgi:hypothetical protein
MMNRHEKEKSTEANEGKEVDGFNREWTPMDTDWGIRRRINHKERKGHKGGKRIELRMDANGCKGGS